MSGFRMIPVFEESDFRNHCSVDYFAASKNKHKLQIEIVGSATKSTNALMQGCQLFPAENIGGEMVVQ